MSERSDPSAHLLLICHGRADLAARADARADAARRGGYASARHLGPDDLGMSDASVTAFRAAVPGAILRSVTDLPPDDLLLVEIHEDPDALAAAGEPVPPARLIAAAAAQPQGFVHGQALCWPQSHHVAHPAFERLTADAAQMGARPFLWPSPALYSASPACLAFLADWTSAAADARVSGDVIDPQGRGADLLRGHEGAWAAGSVLAHLHGAPTLSLVWTAPEQPAADDGTPPPDPLPPADLIGPLTRGGLTLDQAEAWLARKDGPVRIGAAEAQVLDALLIAQLDRIAASGRGRICRDHLAALLRRDGQHDLMLAVLAASRSRGLLALWPVLASRVNLAWIEQVIDGRSHDLHDLRIIVHAHLAALLDEQPKAADMLACSVVWQLIQSERRARYRRRYGALASPRGQQMMERFVQSLPEADRHQLTRPIPLEIARTRLSPDLGARMDAWMEQVPA